MGGFCIFGVTMEKDMRHIVGLSGGKDSTALALRLAEIEPRDFGYLYAGQATHDSDRMAEDNERKET